MKKRYISRKTGKHGVQLSYPELLSKIEYDTDKYWDSSAVGNDKIAKQMQVELESLFFALNIKKYPVFDPTENAWIVGINKVEFVATYNMYNILFTHIDDATREKYKEQL